MPPLKSSKLVIPSGFAHVTVKMTGPNTLHPPSFGFGVDADTPADVGTNLAAWLSDADDGFLHNLHPNYTVDRIIVRTPTATIEQPVSLPGTAVGAGTSPPAVSALVKLISDTPGRRGRGRMYWPGVLGDSDINPAGNIQDGGGEDDTGTARFTDLQACVDLFADTLDSGGVGVVILHSYSWDYGDPDPGPPVGFPAPSPVTAMALQRAVATQRRRQR